MGQPNRIGGIETRSMHVKAYRRLPIVLLVLVVGMLAAGCSGSGVVSGGKELTLGYIGVAEGDLDAFQDVWIPNQKEYLSEVEDDVEHLDPWFEGKTAQGIAVPYYMDVQSLSELDQAGTDMINGIEHGSAVMPQIYNKVIPGYDLDTKLVESSTSAMLSELEKAYKTREPIVFFGWSPHWMNTRYDFRYLEDARDLQGRFNDSAEISSIVKENLSEDDPVAYEFIKSISLSKEQVNQMEADINEAGDPEAGVKAWLEDNRSVVQPWIDAAKMAGEE